MSAADVPGRHNAAESPDRDGGEGAGAQAYNAEILAQRDDDVWDDVRDDADAETGLAPMALLAPPAPRNDPHAWLITFTDLMALLLTFFVMLFAMSTINTSDWHNLSQSLRERLSTLIDQPQASPTFRLDMPTPDTAPGRDLDYVSEILRAHIADSTRLSAAELRRDGGRVILSLPADMLFETGAYRLTERAANAVFALSGVLRNVPNRIEVAGHADPRQPIDRYPSNWELSLLRAQSVASALQEGGYNAPIVARGYGDTQFDDLSKDLPTSERRALARRVDIVVGAAAQETP
jgi:chemotaxis protein MotB